MLNQNYKFKQQGLTLVELMVALTLGLVIMAGVIQLFISSKETYRINTLISQIQESGRFAIEAVAHELRMAGYQGCADPKSVRPVNLVLNSPPVDFFKETAVIGSEGGTASDQLLLRYVSPDSTPLTEPSDPINARFTVADNSQNFSNGDVVMVADCHTAHLIRITDITTTSTTAVDGTVTSVTVITYANTENDLSKLLKTYAKDVTRLMALQSVRFQVMDTGRQNSAGKPVLGLFRKGLKDAQPLELVEGVENMQLLYGERLASGNYRYVKADDSTIDMAKVSSVRLGMLLETTELAGNRDDALSYVLAGTTVVPDNASAAATDVKHAQDRRYRRAFNVTVYLRNRE